MAPETSRCLKAWADQELLVACCRLQWRTLRVMSKATPPANNSSVFESSSSWLSIGPWRRQRTMRGTQGDQIPSTSHSQTGCYLIRSAIKLEIPRSGQPLRKDDILIYTGPTLPVPKAQRRHKSKSLMCSWCVPNPGHTGGLTIGLTMASWQIPNNQLTTEESVQARFDGSVPHANASPMWTVLIMVPRKGSLEQWGKEILPVGSTLPVRGADLESGPAQIHGAADSWPYGQRQCQG